MPTTIAATIVGALLTLVGTLIVFYLRGIKSDIAKMGGRADLQDKRIDNIVTAATKHKDKCRDMFVNKEDWLREAGYSRDQLDKLSRTLSRIEGKMGVMEKLPEICGNIAKEITSQIKKGTS